MNYKTLIARVLAALNAPSCMIYVTGSSPELTKQVADEVAVKLNRKHVSQPEAGKPGENRFTVYLANPGEVVEPPFTFTVQEANVIAYELDDVIRLYNDNRRLLQASVPVLKRMQELDPESQRQQSDAWQAVVELVKSVDPEWAKSGDSGKQAMLNTIKSWIESSQLKCQEVKDWQLVPVTIHPLDRNDTAPVIELLRNPPEPTGADQLDYYDDWWRCLLAVAPRFKDVNAAPQESGKDLRELLVDGKGYAS